MFSIDPECQIPDEMEDDYEVRRDTEEYDPVLGAELDDDCRD